MRHGKGLAFPLLAGAIALAGCQTAEDDAGRLTVARHVVDTAAVAVAFTALVKQARTRFPDDPDRRGLMYAEWYCGARARHPELRALLQQTAVEAGASEDAAIIARMVVDLSCADGAAPGENK